MPVSSQQTGPDSRFQHLLQPIRDLTKNWNVDIASQLDEYLAEIEQISISFDGGTTTMNFAEAALLIQGSACVYSKKVEYLCSLVHEVLGSLASRKKAQAAREENAEGQEDDHAADADKDEEFLVLDDMQEMKNIDAKTKAADLTQGTIQNIPKTPLALIPLEETEKEGEPLLSRAGEVIASRSDFNMNLGHLHPLGVILLDMSHLSLLEHSMRSKPSSTPFVPRPGVVIGAEANDAEDESPMDPEVPPNNISMDDGNDGGCDMPEDIETVVQEEVEKEQRYCLRENARTRLQVAPPTRQPVEAWQPLNPHTSSNTSEKPFRKGRTSRLPPSLKKAAERKRKRKNDGEEKAPHSSLPSIADFCTKAFYSYASKYPSNPLKVPSYPEFEHLFLVELRRRQTQAKQDRRRLMQEAKLRQLAVEDEAEEMEVHADVFDDDVDTGDIDTGDAAGDDFVDVLLPLPVDTETDRPGTNLETETAVVSSFEDMVLNHVEGYLASAQQYVQTTELSRRVSEWAEKIVPRLGIEEKRNTFDIHKYGTSVLERLTESEASQSDPWVSFSKVVETEPQYEVCRMLLASLQLANSSNVDISCDSDFDHTVNSLKLKFLTMRRHHEDLADYRAPSAHV